MAFLKSYIYKIVHQVTKSPSHQKTGALVTGALVTGALVFFGTGCAHYRASPHYAGPKPMPETVSEYYSYEKMPITSKIENIEEKTGYIIKRMRLDSGERKISIEFFESNRSMGKSPCLLVLPILGGSYPIERDFAGFFASEGIHCVLIHRQKYKNISDEGVEHMEHLMRQTLINNRLVIDFLSRQENVDVSKLGTFGISLGGINAAITAAIEPRLKAHVIALAGGNIADIMRDTKDPALTKPREEYLKKRNITMDDFYAAIKRTVKSDPILFAEYIDARKVLMIVAVFDKTLMRKNGAALWRAIGKPEIIYIPLGHYSTYFAKEYVKMKSLQFYKKLFGNF